MKERFITAVFFTLVIGLFVVPGYWQPLLPLLLLILIYLMAAYELRQALLSADLDISLSAVGSGVVILPLAAVMARLNWPLAQSAAALLAMLLLLLYAWLLSGLVRKGPSGLQEAVTGSAALLYLAVPLLSAVLLLFFFSAGFIWFIVGLASPWVSDVFAYLTGYFFGRHPAVPQISPKKTIEGCIGGVAGPMLVLGIFFYMIMPVMAVPSEQTGIYLAYVLLMAAVLGMAAQLGDWLASGIKRWCKIKDFGRLLPGHGGVLDRFDSTLLTFPVTLLLAVLFRIIF